jgi:hypothetical protein
MRIPKSETRAVNLTASGELALQREALALGGVVLATPDVWQFAADTMTLLEHLLAPGDLPPIIQDTGRRAN